MYECEQTGGCVAKYSGPPRSGNTIVSTQLEYLFRQTSDYSTNQLVVFWVAHFSLEISDSVKCFMNIAQSYLEKYYLLPNVESCFIRIM